METENVTKAAVDLLVIYHTSAGGPITQELGKSGWVKLNALQQAIQHRFVNDGDEYALQSLQRLEQKPRVIERQAALIGVLNDKVPGDPTFMRELSRLVRSASLDARIVKVMAFFFGTREVRDILTIDWFHPMNVP